MKPEQMVSKLMGQSGSLKIKAESCYLETEPLVFDDNEKLIEYIDKFNPISGWFAFQNSVVCFTEPEKIADHKDEGFLLNGEAFNQADESLHVRENGNAGWQLTIYKESSTETTEQATNVLVDKTSMLAKAKPKCAPKTLPKIKYRRYWKHTESTGYHVYAARFCGFENGENLS